MAATPAQATLETSLTRLNDGGRALLFTEARTANTFSDRPVTSEQLRAIYELMKWGPTWSNTLPLRIVCGAWMQAAYFIIAVRAAGLAAGPMGGFDTAGLDAEFFPSGDWRSFLIVNIGYSGQSPWYERLPRLDYAEAVRHA
jgi:nitroreductase